MNKKYLMNYKQQTVQLQFNYINLKYNLIIL